jgi:hypothetical protein
MQRSLTTARFPFKAPLYVARAQLSSSAASPQRQVRVTLRLDDGEETAPSST